jgi:hypothetical protein
MIDFEKHKMYIIAAVLVLMVGLYFGHKWHVNQLIDEKLKKITKDRKKKQMRMMRHKQIIEKHEPRGGDYVQQDMDSYIDPGEGDKDGNEPMDQ